MNDSVENSEDTILCFHTLFEFEVLVPERVREEVEADAVCTTLKQSKDERLEA